MRYAFTFILLIASTASFSQSDNYSRIFDRFSNLANNFKIYISSETLAESFKKILEKFNEDSDEYIKGGYGLSFEELNLVRTMKKYSKAFEDFYGFAGAGSNWYGSAKDIRLVTEYFPDVSYTLSFKLDNYISVYKIKIDRYILYVARQTDKEHIKRLSYTCKTPKGSNSGEFGLGYKCFRRIVDNSRFLSTQDFKPLITKVVDIGENFEMPFCTED